MMSEPKRDSDATKDPDFNRVVDWFLNTRPAPHTPKSSQGKTGKP
jgi:hypothetical protein